MEKERELILNGNIRKLLFKFSLPATVGLIVSALYNVVDTLYVGNAIGSLAIAGLAIVMPLQILIFAIGFMIGAGSGSIIARSLGKNDRQRAEITAGNAIILTVAIGLTTMLTCYLFLDKIIYFFGASPDIFSYAKDYMSIILIGFIFLSFDVVGNNIIRAEGKPRAAMYPLIIGAVLNIILDPVFIFALKMGVKGAAIATVISQFISMIYIFIYFNSGKSIYKTRRVNFKLNFPLMIEIIKIGFPSFLMSIVDSVIFILFNRSLVKFGNDIYIAVMRIAIRIMDLTLMPLIGIMQGYSTITGFNYGAKNFKRVKIVLKEAVIWTTIISGLSFLIIFGFPGFLLGIFSKDSEMIKMGIVPFRIISSTFITLGIQFVGGNLFQAIGKPLPALILNIARQVIFLIPAIIIFPKFFGLNGIWLSLPFSDILSTILCIIFIAYEIKVINKMQLEHQIKGL